MNTEHTMKFLFVRHGETEWNVKKKIQGKTDIPLNEKGVQQAEELAEKLAAQGKKVAKVYTSPQLRAKKTAEILAEALHAECVCRDGLREMELGLWEGSNWSSIREEYGERYLYWNAHRRYTKTPEGESYNDVLERTLKTLRDIMDEETEDVLVVTHSAVLMALFCYIAKEPFTEEVMLEHHRLGNAEAAEVDFGEIADACHSFFVEKI